MNMKKGTQRIRKTGKKKTLFIEHHLSPGDVLMLSSAIRDLYQAYNKKFEINVDTSCNAIFDENPYLNREITKETADMVIDAEYPLINNSNNCQYHFILNLVTP